MITKLFQFSLALLLLLTSFGCKKEKIEPPVTVYSETPVFTVTGSLEGNSVLFQAGVENAYLENFNTVVNGVNRFGGRIIQGDNYVEIALYDGNLSLPNSTFPSTTNTIALSQDFSLPLIKILKSSCNNFDVISDLQFTVDGNEMGGDLSIIEPGVYEICTKITFYDGTYKTVCNEVVVGYRDLGEFVLKTSLTGNSVVNGLVQSSLPINSIDWYLDEQFLGTNMGLLQQLNNGLHELTATVHFENGVTRSHSVIVDGTNSMKYLQDINSFKSGINSSLYQDFKGEISIRKDGVLYKHLGGAGSSNIFVTNYSYFGKSSSGADIYKISGVVTAQMKNTISNEVSTSQFNVVFGLEIP